MSLLFECASRNLLSWPHTRLSLHLPPLAGAILCMARRCAALAFTHGVARASISASFITFTTCPIVGVPNMMGTLFAK